MVILHGRRFENVDGEPGVRPIFLKQGDPALNIKARDSTGDASASESRRARYHVQQCLELLLHPNIHEVYVSAKVLYPLLPEVRGW